MSEKKIQVPEGMLKASLDAGLQHNIGASQGFREWLGEYVEPILEAALLYQKEHPPVPTDAQANELWKIALELSPAKNETTHAAKNIVIAWVRRMYDAPEPEVPEAIKDLLWGVHYYGLNRDKEILEAYRRGQQAPVQHFVAKS